MAEVVSEAGEPTKLSSFKRTASIAVRLEGPPTEEPAVTVKPCLTPSTVEVEELLERELATMSTSQQANKLASFKRSTSIAVRPEGKPDVEPVPDQPLMTPSTEELEAMLERDLARMASTPQGEAPKVSVFKRSMSIAVKPEEVPVEEPVPEQPVPTPSQEELEAMLEIDSKVASA